MKLIPIPVARHDSPESCLERRSVSAGWGCYPTRARIHLHATLTLRGLTVSRSEKEAPNPTVLTPTQSPASRVCCLTTAALPTPQRSTAVVEAAWPLTLTRLLRAHHCSPSAPQQQQPSRHHQQLCPPPRQCLGEQRSVLGEQR